MINTAKPATNSEMFRGLRSLCSWPDSAWMGSAVFVSAILFQSMFFDDRHETRITKRQQRPAMQLPEKHAEPEAADAERRQHHRPMQRPTFRVKGRRDKPPDLDEMHRRNQYGHGEQRRSGLFHRTG